MSPCLLAVSGGVDSLTLAVFAHRLLGADFAAVHAGGPAVPEAARDRLGAVAAAEGFALTVIDAGEVRDARYAANPADRCYYCKSSLFSAMARLAGLAGATQTDTAAHGQTPNIQGTPGPSEPRQAKAGLIQSHHAQAGQAASGQTASDHAPRQATLISGTNRDDLADFRPGLQAAAERGVRHPYVEADMDKAAVRRLARALGLTFADIPASPCLASRIYTGTAVTPERLRAVDLAETFVKGETGLAIVRCRVRGAGMLIETLAPDAITPDLAARLAAMLRAAGYTFDSVAADASAYAPGRAFAKPS